MMRNLLIWGDDLRIRGDADRKSRQNTWHDNCGTVREAEIAKPAKTTTEDDR
jgi:hypothetical protein